MSSLTPNIGFILPDTGEQNWGVDLNNNFTKIDTLLALVSNNLLVNPHFRYDIFDKTQTSQYSWIFPGWRINLEGSPNYTLDIVDIPEIGYAVKALKISISATSDTDKIKIEQPLNLIINNVELHGSLWYKCSQSDILQLTLTYQKSDDTWTANSSYLNSSTTEWDFITTNFTDSIKQVVYQISVLSCAYTVDIFIAFPHLFFYRSDKFHIPEFLDRSITYAWLQKILPQRGAVQFNGTTGTTVNLPVKFSSSDKYGVVATPLQDIAGASWHISKNSDSFTIYKSTSGTEWVEYILTVDL